ncbi:kinesin-like protein Klp8 [Scheffersomyces spartinae]|uniref:Kinesin-like protein Klp8 n=1 Tax=Scheffersomyces spartinae TaxID=45513 RepID=A0A9P8AKA5_9ASCO|nr:kinesin-like protein Klp8 [Scheffersomyces spartinae]KAG7194942.1 kinesin-like protein Klp8 [Scheffersomyces spartinae]
MNDQTTKIKVLVRVRPLLPREASDGITESLVQMPDSDPTSVSLLVPTDSPYYSQHINTVKSESIDEYKHYEFDECIWSFNANDPHYVNNLQFYDKSGPDIIEHFFKGYNVCLLTYGQTGSGKTFTMMGDDSQPGLIPLIVRDILRQKEHLIGERINCQVKVSYMEIYNEQVNDLLDTASGSSKKCKVREHPVSGPYVENLKEIEISDFKSFRSQLDRGNKNRSTAATSMNDKSSRSHAILQLTLKQTRYRSESEDLGFDDSSDSIGDAEEEVISNIKLVDLAGSERLNKTKNFGQQDRMKEGSLINKSLTVLGRCINILATNSSNSGMKPNLVPFRDSILTYILKENLSGNSKSFMIFNISPVDFEETYQTLNYAKQVTKIKTRAKANTNKLNSKPIDWERLRGDDQDIIDSLKKEINDLNSKLAQIGTDSPVQQHHPEFENMVLFLEHDLDRVKFENKYLKLKILQKSSQVNELLSYIKYMEGEFKILSQESIHMRRSLWNSLNTNCDSSMEGLNQALDQFDPKRIL